MTGPLSKSPSAISKSGIPLLCRELQIGRMAQINTERYAEDGSHDELVKPLARCRASGELLREPLQPGRLLHTESALRRPLDREGRGRPRPRGGSEPRGFLHPATARSSAPTSRRRSGRLRKLNTTRSHVDAADASTWSAAISSARRSITWRRGPLATLSMGPIRSSILTLCFSMPRSGLTASGADYLRSKSTARRHSALLFTARNSPGRCKAWLPYPGDGEQRRVGAGRLHPRTGDGLFSAPTGHRAAHGRSGSERCRSSPIRDAQ